MLSTGEIYRELRADYYRQREDPERVTAASRDNSRNGYAVTLTAA